MLPLLVKHHTKVKLFLENNLLLCSSLHFLNSLPFGVLCTPSFLVFLCMWMCGIVLFCFVLPLHFCRLPKSGVDVAALVQALTSLSLALVLSFSACVWVCSRQNYIFLKWQLNDEQAQKTMKALALKMVIKIYSYALFRHLFVGWCFCSVACVKHSTSTARCFWRSFVHRFSRSHRSSCVCSLFLFSLFSA